MDKIYLNNLSTNNEENRTQQNKNQKNKSNENTQNDFVDIEEDDALPDLSWLSNINK